MGQSVARDSTSAPRSRTPVPSVYAVFETACGWMGLVGSGCRVSQLRLGYDDPRNLRNDLVAESLYEPVDEEDWNPLLRQRLQAYASGREAAFDDVRCELRPLTPFQQAVIDYVRRIPYGAVMSYGEVAAAVGYPGAARAVGTVMSSNRIPIIIPCHRVVAAGGKLGGYSAPRGVELKQWLLELERRGAE